MIRVVDLHKAFGGQRVLQGVNLELETGKITTIIGGSGSGKTVLLKHLNALLLPDRGCVLVDGTFWTEDEMIESGLGAKTASDMGHLPQTSRSGRPGMIAALDRIGVRRKVLIHINNSNPILDEDSVQRRELQRHGIEVAHDGMEIEL